MSPFEFVGTLFVLQLGAAISTNERFHALVGILFAVLFLSVIALFGNQDR